VSEELQLTGHGGAFRLVAVPGDDGRGRTLLVSAHQGGAVRVWDPWTGEPVAGPVRLDEGEGEGTVNDLAVAHLGPDGGRVLVTCGPRSVGLRHPRTLHAAAGALPRRVARQGAWALAVLPATASTPELLVTVGRTGVRVTAPASSRTHLKLAQPPRRHLGGDYCLLTPVRLDGGTPGFAVGRARWGVEVWAPARRTWQRRHRWDHLRSPGGGMAFLTSEWGEPWLAVAVGRDVTVWDLGTGRLKAEGDLDTRVMALAAVPLGERTVLAVSGQNGGAGVRLWDPSTGRTLGDLFNGHGPPRTPAPLSVDALAVIPGPDGTVRIASAANDGVIRVSPPSTGPDDTPPERLPDLGQPEEEQDGPGGRFALVRERLSGAVQGFWFADPEHATNRDLIDALLHREGLHRLVGTRYRTEPNTLDDRGGAFVLFD
jgi:hypothetical protein